jgi:hypothetical protein
MRQPRERLTDDDLLSLAGRLGHAVRFGDAEAQATARRDLDRLRADRLRQAADALTAAAEADQR